MPSSMTEFGIPRHGHSVGEKRVNKLNSVGEGMVSSCKEEKQRFQSHSADF